MIVTGLVFALGVLVATLVCLLFIPLLWRKAQNLARRDFEATIPVTATELRGEADRVRAETAFAIRRQEVLAAEIRDRAAAERAEAGKIVLENGQLRAEQARLTLEGGELKGKLQHLEQTIAALTGERDKLTAKNADLRRNLDIRAQEMEALAGKFRALGEQSNEMKRRIAVMEGEQRRRHAAAQQGAKTDAVAPTDELANPPRNMMAEPAPALADFSTEEREIVKGSERLRAAIAVRGGGGKAPPSPQDHAEVRNRISELAARVIRLQMRKEGPGSSLARLIDNAPGPAVDGHPTLAERVRRLSEAEPDAGGAVTKPTEAPAPIAALPNAGARKNGGGRSRRKPRR